MKPNQKLGTSKKTQVENMFNAISIEYDFINKLITFGNDIKWRKKVYEIAKESMPKRVLDIATGTGDIALELANIEGAKIIGLDISEKMLDLGRQKILKQNLSDKIDLISGDAESLAYSNNYFDVITIGFGVRNFQNLIKGLDESRRVLKENGKLIILESSIPKNPIIRFFYFIISKVYIPFLGLLFSKDKSAYNYLQKSAEKFPSGNKFVEILKKCGFKNIKTTEQMLGATSIYIAQK
ncbi:MAG: bifunctional demethylmenaquinone methyltransferase/2-methoxy-6-polyprenyl-1,4-benzoquinol methylase UbiE [Flavobacteriaceae bacterium]|nr:bifunctional demethylmenaquinone methyltransferase/2-methoxy-6-polyprenyl-1,4-benzoquinol methylase UbiE [Flavobacteriaceae bacterium]|tara:strand:+ start:4343 stop:5059 length:717 start_codon:yes stop_codon:yes gene_type:complete